MSLLTTLSAGEMVEQTPERRRGVFRHECSHCLVAGDKSESPLDSGRGLGGRRLLGGDLVRLNLMDAEILPAVDVEAFFMILGHTGRVLRLKVAESITVTSTGQPMVCLHTMTVVVISISLDKGKAVTEW